VDCKLPFPSGTADMMVEVRSVESFLQCPCNEHVALPKFCQKSILGQRDFLCAAAGLYVQRKPVMVHPKFGNTERSERRTLVTTVSLSFPGLVEAQKLYEEREAINQKKRLHIQA
jgi:hypothetical protein